MNSMTGVVPNGNVSFWADNGKVFAQTQRVYICLRCEMCWRWHWCNFTFNPEADDGGNVRQPRSSNFPPPNKVRWMPNVVENWKLQKTVEAHQFGIAFWACAGGGELFNPQKTRNMHGCSCCRHQKRLTLSTIFSTWHRIKVMNNVCSASVAGKILPGLDLSTWPSLFWLLLCG